MIYGLQIRLLHILSTGETLFVLDSLETVVVNYHNKMSSNSENHAVILSRHSCKRGEENIKYRIQLVTPDLYEGVVDHMIEYFLKREIMNSYYDVASKPESTECMRTMWSSMVKEGAVVVALLDLDNNNNPANIIGANITVIEGKGKKSKLEIKDEGLKKVMDTFDAITTEGNLFERYKIQKYLSSYGLSVSPKYNGLGIGLELLKSRQKICEIYQLKMTATVFSSPISQHLAKKSGFHVVVEHDYKTYFVDGQIFFPKLEGKLILMSKLFD